MATFTCPDCGAMHDVFGSGGGQELAEALGTELLGRIPIDPRLVEASDSGAPLVVSHPDVPAAQAMSAVAQRLAARKSSLLGRKLPVAMG
jgi:ATP-binding protein involved in chromosome partitioning